MRFDQRHKWVFQTQYKAKCRVCGVEEEVPVPSDILRRAFALSGRVESCNIIPEKNKVLKDMPFISRR